VEVKGGGCFLVFFKQTLTPTLKTLAAQLLKAKFLAAHLLHGVGCGLTQTLMMHFLGHFCQTIPNHICSINPNATAALFAWCHTCSYSTPFEHDTILVAVGCLDWVC